MQTLFKRASKLLSLPVLEKFVPAANIVPDEVVREGYLSCQRLAQKAVYEVSKLLQEGWTEQQTARMIETFLRDSGVYAFFHHPFVWFGSRTRFDGIRHYIDYQPSKRVLRPEEIFILDVAPIFKGYIADIGYTSALNPSPDLIKAKEFLKQQRKNIPKLFNGDKSGGEIWKQIDREIRSAGFLNIHKKYPFSVLGHRVHQTNETLASLKFLHFGWQSYWSLLSRGLFGQLFNENFEGDISGLWAIEPHIGMRHFGAKFEEILVVNKNGVSWLETEPQYGSEFL